MTQAQWKETEGDLPARPGRHALAAHHVQREPDAGAVASLEKLDAAYRALVSILYNHAPLSGHPGGSVSAGRILSTLLVETMDHDPGDPLRDDADVLCLAAGHKALGLYAMLALLDECVRIARPDLLPATIAHRLRLEDLLGFRRNPHRPAPLASRFDAKALDGHPTPATPRVPVATGPSGVGVAQGVGLAIAALDTYGPRAPRIHVIEGEGGLTPGRVSESLACASASGLANLVLHVDWNQATIDSDACCRDGDAPGDYVQWNPVDLARLHGWNTILVEDGRDVAENLAAQRLAQAPPGGRPTCIVYRTVKGRGYGIEGRGSHGAGHAFLGEAYWRSLEDAERALGFRFERWEGDTSPESTERGQWAALENLRRALESEAGLAARIASRAEDARRRLDRARRAPRGDTGRMGDLRAALEIDETPVALVLEPGSRTTLRESLGRALGHLEMASGGAVLGASADLLDSTSVALLAEGFPRGFFGPDNRGSRILSAGGICEDAMAGIVSGISSRGTHLGVGSSYAAFIAPLSHISARCHAIGQEAKTRTTPEPPHPMLLVMGHASIKTGEDGPTHADPQALQLYQENFPPGLCVTLTPWSPDEVWPLLRAALRRRPAVVAAYVTRPPETVPDRAALDLPPAEEAARGVWTVRRASRPGGEPAAAVVLQGSGVTNEFMFRVLPELDAAGPAVDVLHVSSVELFDALPREERDRILAPGTSDRAMAITDFTLPTLYRFVTSPEGREASLHPFRRGGYPGSGKAERVLEQAGLDARSQLDAIRRFAARVAG